MKNKLVIVGSGPAGYAAGLYAARADMAPVIFAGSEPGGQLMKTTEIENYPGIPKGTTGPALMLLMQDQVTRFGGKLIYETVKKIEKNAEGFELVTENQSYETEAVILAMGAAPRLLMIGEEKYWGKGLSTCAVCDAAFYRGKRAVIVGGGDAAVEDALALAKFASKVTMVVRRDTLRASVAMAKRVTDNKAVEIIWNTQVTKVIGEEKIEKVELTNNDGTKTLLETDGLFLAIGHKPATEFLRDSQIKLDSEGYIVTNGQNANLASDKERVWPTMTSVEGIFAGGDCVDKRYRQAVVAAGMGVSAFLDAEKWLVSR